MIDDHDRCEWLNVSLDTGLPGLSWTKSRDPLNGCVCVCMHACVRAYVYYLLFGLIMLHCHGAWHAPSDPAAYLTPSQSQSKLHMYLGTCFYSLLSVFLLHI